MKINTKPIGGTYTLTYKKHTSKPIPFDADADIYNTIIKELMKPTLFEKIICFLNRNRMYLSLKTILKIIKFLKGT